MSVKVAGYRRFENPSIIDVASDVVALVGPNEAGKSTILSAMLAINEDSLLTNRERSRDSDATTSVECTYVLDDSDRRLLREVPGGEAVRWWTYEISDTGIFFELYPTPKRDLQPRHELGQALARFAMGEWLTPFRLHLDILHVDGAEESAADLCEMVIGILSSSDDDLDSVDIQMIHEFAEEMDKVPAIAHLAIDEDDVDSDSGQSDFSALLAKLVAYDEGDDRHTEAGHILCNHRPKFLAFSASDRDLSTTYDLSEVIESVPPALANLARLAQLDLRRVLEAEQDGNRPLRTRLIDSANSTLERAFSRSWRQEAVTVHLELQGTILELLVTLPGGGYSELEERSDGLRWFVALRAFLEGFDLESSPILLVDEAETHLHYDAQADLVNLFVTQDLAAKIIYTTHSAGCLPQDLGNGVRAVVPMSDRERSTVRNSVWVDGDAGVTPLIYAMGATAFGLLPARYVVIVEGAVDAMLYPTLLREATGDRSLLFQVVPGLAVAAPARMSGLSSEAGKVAFLADGDKDGRKYQRELARTGVPSGYIFGLDKIFVIDIELEDLVAPNVYADAVTYVLQTYQDTPVSLSTTDLPRTKRSSEVVAWCARHALKPPDKRDVAQRLLDMKSETARRGEELLLLDSSRKADLASLCRSLSSLFEHAG